MSARVQKILPELKRISRLKDKDRKNFIATCNKDLIHCICECTRNLLKGHLPLKKCHFKSLSSQTLAEKIVVEKDCIEPTKKDTTERWISSSINSNTGISSEWFQW
jgi:hypothetical protein